MTQPKEHFDVLLVVPLEEELLQVQGVFPTKRNLSTDVALRLDVETGDPDISMLMVQQEAMGKTAAYHAVSETLAEFSVGLVVCLGIAGSLTDDIALCDVCYSEAVIDVYDNTKASDTKDGMEIALSPTFKESPKPLVAAFNFIRTFPDLQPRYAEWQAERETVAKGMFPSQVVGRKGVQETIGAPKSKPGKVVCAAVSKSERYNAKIRNIDRKIMAIETESGGVFEAAARKGVEAFTIRGISDYADDTKTQLEASTGGRIRELAAQNAATFLRLMFTTPNVKAVLHRSRANRQLALDLVSETKAQPRPVASVLTSFAETIDQKLREFSPEYKLLEKGYRLPVPRMRNVQYVSGVGTRFAADPEEAREALEQHEAILLGLSKNYPDYSLPWVIANDLLTAEIGGKQMLPVVVDGDAVRPPRVGLGEAAYYDFKEVEGIPGTQLVFIIDGVPLSSRTKTDFLAKQIKERPDARFIILTRDETHIIGESEFCAAVKADLYQLSSISFLEIAHFVEKNFGMTASEAEVIALRLRDTFQTFDLSAHPTYFAGISKEVLSALLQANRRAELIQLAVDGFLSLVVLGDKANVTLSRTTRARFLRMLAHEIRVEKRTVNKERLVGIAADFAKERDFEVDPTAFVASFVDSGILHFSDERVLFSLPFVESYLLAVELAENPQQAERYFDVDADDFDLGTFDLYCEINPAQQVVDKVLQGLERGRRSMELPTDTPHILLTDAVRPAMLGRNDRLKAIEERFNRLTNDVKSGKGDVKAKQRMLDMADQVREAASDRSGLKEEEGEEENAEDTRVFHDATRYWAIGAKLLGAGAEHLKADTKQQICTAVVEMAATLSHAWTEAYSKVDFEELRKDFTSDENVRSINAGASEQIDLEETRRQIGSLVDLLEFSLLAAPLRRLLDYLCEAARLRVLAVSVEKAEPKGAVQAMVHAAWLADIEGRRGHKRLNEAIKDLPPSPFLRVVIATHLMTRVYWNQSDKEDRLKLLDAAELALSPFITIRKGEIIRYIEGKGAKISSDKKSAA
jgi:nucleoside phosphorylase